VTAMPEPLATPPMPTPGAAATQAPRLEAAGVSRWYGQVIGVQGVDCTVGPGITGLLGLNGAGKSTLFKLLAGQLRPSKGVVRVFGHDLAKNRGLYRRIGFCPEPDALYEFMTGREMLVYLLRLQGFDGKEAARRAADALERCHLSDAADRRVAGYSKGMRQKIKLAQAMAHDPDILFLDEPFNGMDPPSRHESMEVVRQLGREGKVVMLSSHILHEVEAMTSTILLMQNGRILAEGHISDIRDLIERHPHKVRIECDRPRTLAAHLLDGDDVLGVRVESEKSVIIETNLPRRFFRRLPQVVLDQDLKVHSYSTLDDNLKSLFEYLVEGN